MLLVQSRGEARMADAVLPFYEGLAADYHLIFRDWRETVVWQGDVFDRLVRAEMRGAPLSILDRACGIGTQAIGLALRGHAVRATDLSPAAVARGVREAASFGVSVGFSVADLRSVGAQVGGTFDVVMACDNALPHLLTDDELRVAARNMKSKLRTDGLLVASIRDYDAALAQRPRSTLPRVYDDPEGKRVVFQVWDWMPDGRTYTLHFLFMRNVNGEWHTTDRTTVYRAVRREELGRVLREAGFSDVRWHTTDVTGYYQPIVTARNPRPGP
jgi:glycine/sarcosine N-methyltransferase